jgi:hypothetical protein
MATDLIDLQKASHLPLSKNIKHNSNAAPGVPGSPPPKGVRLNISPEPPGSGPGKGSRAAVPWAPGRSPWPAPPLAGGGNPGWARPQAPASLFAPFGEEAINGGHDFGQPFLSLCFCTRDHNIEHASMKFRNATQTKNTILPY